VSCDCRCENSRDIRLGIFAKKDIALGNAKRGTSVATLNLSRRLPNLGIVPFCSPTNPTSSFRQVGMDKLHGNGHKDPESGRSPPPLVESLSTPLSPELGKVSQRTKNAGCILVNFKSARTSDDGLEQRFSYCMTRESGQGQPQATRRRLQRYAVGS
jgi:hypothetical protein